MKKTIFIVVAVLSLVVSKAQDITVESFNLIETDLTANTSGTIVLDQNGERCALIKVATSQTDFTFDAGMMGVVKTIQKESEIWVYVPAGVKRLSISHVGMDALRDYDLGMSVQKACTYLLVLKTSKDVVLQTVNFDVTPVNASIMLESIDENSDFGKKSIPLSNGKASLKVPVGSYKYMAMSVGYIVEDGTFSLSAQSSRNVVLKLIPESTPAGPVTPEKPVKPQAPAPTLGSNTSTEPPASQTFTVKGVSFKMIEVQGGTFNMGATSEQTETTYLEEPVHSVTLNTFFIGETEVTQELWQAVMGKNPSLQKHKDNRQNPVEQVSWNDCQTFIAKLNSLTGKKFRLPTEAEWEYAARGGNRSKGYKYSGGNDIGRIALYDGNLGTTHSVKTKSPNELGVYDMSGSVNEWCQDWYGEYPSDAVTNPTGPSNGSGRVFRGGCGSSSSSGCRVSYRWKNDPLYGLCTIGLRLAL